MHSKRTLAGAIAVLALAACPDATTPEPAPEHLPTQVVPGQYIVVFRDGVTDPMTLADRLLARLGGTLRFRYGSALKGFSAKTDAKASFSNWGACVEAYAPGSAIVSDFLAGTTMSLSGTSMASPHVAGVAVLYKATFGDAPSATVSNWIIGNAVGNVITGNPGGTPNRLVNKSTL